MATINEQINKAVEYILNNLENDITVKEIADHCHFSEFYFNRLFKTVVGESVYAFIKRRRLERSAFDLSTKPGQTITEIAAQYGYSASNYSSAFKKHYNESPHFFKLTRGEKTGIPLESYEYFNDRIEDIVLDPFTVLYERHIGSYHDLSFQWDEFMTKYALYATDKSKYVEISYDDPIITEPNRCIYDICMTITPPYPKGVSTMTFEGGHYKSFRFSGHVNEILAIFQGLFQIWFLQSNIELDHRKILTIYHSSDCDAQTVVMDICIPC